MLGMVSRGKPDRLACGAAAEQVGMRPRYADAGHCQAGRRRPERAPTLLNASSADASSGWPGRLYVRAAGTHRCARTA